jgi:3-phenylpropionate/cinnamic acid dioxygenase small subunit
MSTAAVAITNLLYRYAELIDAGDLEAAAEMFRFATVKSGPEGRVLEPGGLLALFRSLVRIHACGTPRTKHVVTNPILEIDEDAGWARCRSYYTVLQAAPGLPLQPIVAGRYHDAFACVDGAWRFAERDYSRLDLIGDVSQHLTPGWV